MNSNIRFLDHPSDIGIQAHGASRAEAFASAAAALVSLLLDPSTVDTTERRSIAVTASDEEQLLVRWLSEILFLYDGNRFVCRNIDVSTCTATAIEATVSGEPFDPRKHTARTDIKAVTYHQLAIWHDDAGWGVRVYVDV